MTQQEEKEIIRICGPNYKENDVPTYIRKRDEKWRCGECGEIREGDDRVAAGMKCGHCAYGY